MAITPSALRTELITDPSALGYSPHWNSGNDVALVDLLNQIRATIDIDETLLPAHTIFEAIVPSEWNTITAQEKDRISLILSMSEVNVKGANTRAAFNAAFGAGTVTRSNLVALLTRKGSRSEQLFGVAASINDIVLARLA